MTQKQQEQTMLLVSLDEAKAQIRERIEKGQELLELPIGNEAELEHARNERDKWSDYNAKLLRRIVDTDELINEYHPPVGPVSLSTKPLSLYARVEEFHSDVKKYIDRLESILGYLPLIPESPALA